MDKAMNDGDDFSILGEAGETEEQLDPIYCTEPGQEKGNLSCSSSKDFCYLCSYMDTTLANDLDLNAHIDMLLSEGKELPAIVKAVLDIYNNELRESCFDEAGNAAPEWKAASVTRHLLHNNRDVFNSYTENVLQHLIVRQSESVISRDTKRVDHKERRALLESIDALARWKQRCRPARPKRPATSMD
jgi:hypothetical protein